MRRIAGLLLLAVAACAGPTSPGDATDATDATDEGVPSSGSDEGVVPFDPTPYVDPFIGTGGHGHTFPGATVPFGMVQLSPDTRLDGWDGCSGYHHDDEWIYGFSHTHLSGTGCSDYGDVLLMPGVGDVEWNGGADGKPGYRQRFRHADEAAGAGWYTVTFADTKVKAELTATTRVGVHRYTFPDGAARPHVLLDLGHRDKVIECGYRVVGDREVRGFRRSAAWARDQRVYFVARFSRPFGRPESPPPSFAVCMDPGDGSHHASGEGLSLDLPFAPTGEPVVVTVGISGVDEDGALRNLEAEVPVADFDAVRAAAEATWCERLARVRVRGGTAAQLRNFYTALYHCYVAPNVWGDADGRYRGRDGAIHTAEGWTQHTVFSLWDTFRALHPLMTILEPERTNDWVRTFLAQHREGGALPVWELAANETDCMIGYHAVPVIADAYAKGIRGYDAREALAAMVASADRDVFGLRSYRENGFVAAQDEGESVSRTLEYAYDDWCIAETARALGDDAVARRFLDRAASWTNLFDPATGFFRPRRNQTWVEPFDPSEVNFHLTEANSWQYSMFVPHDIDALRALHGGPEGLERRLDALFSAPSRTTGREQADITGLIGQYAHGNEPSHAMAYLYAYTPSPWKGEARIREILSTLYADRPDGLCGNEDCGQMSAWYVMSALGFYPACPGRPEYVCGTPLFPEVRIDVGGGRRFTVRAQGDGPHVADVRLDGARIAGRAIPHAAIAAGGTLTFTMTDERARREPADAPSAWTDRVPVPFVASGPRVFADAAEIRVGGLGRIPSPAQRAAGARIEPVVVEASLDGGATWRAAESPIRIEATSDVLLRSVASGGLASRIASAKFLRVAGDRSIVSCTPWAPQYAANGERNLVDGLLGGTDFRSGEWQGWQGTDVVVRIDLGRVREIRSVRVGCLQDERSWIWMPSEIRVVVANEPGQWSMLHDSIETQVDRTASGSIVRRFSTSVRGDRARFVQVTARNAGPCPPWHPGAGGKSWIFLDEIEIDAE